MQSANIIKTSNKEVRLQENIARTKKNPHRIGEMFSNSSAYELLLIIFKGQVIFIRMVENSDLKEKDVYLVPCF